MEKIICLQTKITLLTKTFSILLFFFFVFYLFVKKERFVFACFCVKKEIYIFIYCNWRLARIRSSWSAHDESMTYIYCSLNFYINREHKQLADEPTSNEKKQVNISTSDVQVLRDSLVNSNISVRFKISHRNRGYWCACTCVTEA